MSELEDFIKSNHEAFDNREPDPAVLERIQQQMRGTVKKKGKTVVVPMRVLLRVAACIVLVASAVTFWIIQKEPVKTETAAVIKNVQPSQPVAKDQPVNKDVIADVPQRSHTDAIEAELASRKQVLFAKLNNMESPSQRLTAATQAYEMKHTDNDIVDALVNSMNNDPSTNVRLAALEALSKFYREAYVKKQLIASLKKQKDPMVQIELIQLLTKMKETSILKELDKIVNDGNTMEAVKDHAYSSIFTLRS